MILAGINRNYVPAISLGITQIVGYGALYYAYAILLPEMAADLGLSLTAIFGILSLALFVSGFLAPVAGRLTDIHGGRIVMTFGSLAAGLALILLAFVQGKFGLFFAIMLVEAAAIFVLYNVAFASVARLDLTLPTQRSISIITLFGGVASTIFWPLTLLLYRALGWETTWVILGISVIVICVPLHYFGLKGPLKDLTATPEHKTSDWPELTGAARRRGMLWMVISFIFSGYLMGAVMTLWVTNVQDLGHTAAMAALAGAIIGPFKTVGRFLEMLVSRNMYPLITYALSLGLMFFGFVVLLTLGFTLPGVILAAALYGMGDGIKTIARGTLPLALFGAKGYGARLGWISFVQMGINASAPFAFAWATQSFGGWWSFAAMALCLCCAMATYIFIPDPRKPTHDSPQDRRLPENI
ncbi:MAG: MFS transporter [Yoonia sp.]|uniref:MFS transporter n=1 Tax=Yoonia sp. TaxID=2212373 RepID=UPI003EF34ACF